MTLLEKTLVRPGKAGGPLDRALLWCCVLGTATLGAALYLATFAPRPITRCSGWLVIGWVAMAAFLSARAAAKSTGEHLLQVLLRTGAGFGWAALLGGSYGWGMSPGSPITSEFLVLFPVTLPGAVQAIWTWGRSAPNGRYMMAAISVIAIAHLIYFHPIALGTRVFLLALAIVSGLAWRSTSTRDHPP